MDWKRWLVAISATALATACSPDARLHTTSLQAFKASAEVVAHQLPARERATFEKVQQRFLSAYFPAGTKPAHPKGLPDWRAVEGMTAQEFDRFFTNATNPHIDPLGAPHDFPDQGIARRLMEEYQLELQLSQQARTAIQDAGKNTLDQFPITDVTLIPPPVDAPAELDFARFAFHLHNKSGYDAYHPIYHVQVIDPSNPAPLLERTFDDGDAKTLIEPDGNVAVQLTCCGVTLDPVNNQLLKTLPANVQFRVTLLDIHDHNNSSVLNTTDFDQSMVDRLPVLNRCIQILSKHLRTWTPPKPGEPECGPDAEASPVATAPTVKSTGAPTTTATTNASAIAASATQAAQAAQAEMQTPILPAARAVQHQ